MFLILRFKSAPFPVFVVSLPFRCKKRVLSSSHLYVSLSAYSLASARLPLGGVPWNLTLGSVTKICQDSPKFNKTSDKNIGHITKRPNYVYIVDSRTKCFATRQQYGGNPFLPVHGIAQRIHVTENHAYVNNSKKAKAPLHFHTKHVYTKARQSGVICTLPISLLFNYSFWLHVLLPTSGRMIVMQGR